MLCSVFGSCVYLPLMGWTRGAVSSSTVQGAVLLISVGPWAGEATVLAHMQLLTALTVGVAGRLPVHLGKMSFKRAALCKCFPASSAAEWADPCADRQRGRGQGNDLGPKPTHLALCEHSSIPTTGSADFTYIPLSPTSVQTWTRHLCHHPHQVVPSPGSRRAVGGLPSHPSVWDPNPVTSACLHTPQQAPTLALPYAYPLKYEVFQT